MSTYCTLADLRTAQSDATLGQLLDDALADASLPYTDPDFWADSGVLAVVDAAIADASTAIDEYVAGRVDTTDTAVQASLQRYAVALALEWLYRRQGHGASNPWVEQARTARARLREMRAGDLSAGASEQPQLLCESTTDGVEPTYGRDSEGKASSLLEAW